MENDFYNDPLWAQAVQQQESGGNPYAVNPASGAEGSMQVLPTTQRDPGFGVTPARDDSPEEKKRVGEDYLKAMGNKFQNSTDSLVAYNWGPAKAEQWIKNGRDAAALPKETQQYIQKVHGNYQQLKAGNTSTSEGTEVPVAYNTDSGQITEKNLPNGADASTSDDPWEIAKGIVAKKQAAGAAPTSAGAATSDDPWEIAKGIVAKKQATAAQEQAALPPEKPFVASSTADTLSDVAKSAGSKFVQGVNELPKLPANLVTFGSQLAAQGGNKLHNAMYPELAYSPAQEAQKIQSAGDNPVSNLLNQAPTFSQVPALMMRPNSVTPQEVMGTPDPNPVLNSLHTPETGLGEIAGAAAGAIPSGKLLGFSNPVAAGGGAGSEVANQLSPNNPLGQAVGGLIGGAAYPGIKAMNFRTPPTEIANKIIQGNAGDGGPPPPGGGGGNALRPEDINLSEIVPGSKPTLAEATGNANIALLERQRQMQDPKAFDKNEEVREIARKEHFETAAGTPEDIEALRSEREDKSGPQYEVARKQPLQPEAIKPVLDRIDAAIEEVGEGSEAGKTLQGIRAKITGAMPGEDAAGKPKNPTQSPLVQIYREERDNLQKPATAQGAYAGTVKSVIQPIVSDLGAAIESQSPAFAKAQQVYRELSPKISAAEWLQGLKLTNASGNFTLAKVKNALENAKKQQNSPGIKAAKNLSPEQMEVLQNLHDDLQRREKVASASMPRNSTTVQNEIAQKALNSGLSGRVNQLTGGNAPRMAGTALGSAIGGYFGFPTLGAVAGEAAGGKIGNALSGKSAKSAGELQNYLLNPADYKQYLMNNMNNTFVDKFKGNLLSQ